MGFNAMDYSVNIIAFEKNGKKFGMCCAWGMQVDYDKMVFLLGKQSQTGEHVNVGDQIGVSVLAKNQKEIALKLGDHHSLETDKFHDIAYEKNGTALLIPQASRMMVCEVLDVLHLKGIEEDNLLYVQIKKSTEFGNDFLHFGEF